MARWTLSEVTSIPKAGIPIQGIPPGTRFSTRSASTTFGVNLFVATSANQLLVEEHDEQAIPERSGQ